MVEFEIMFPDVLPDKVEKFSQLIAEKYQLKTIKFNSKEEILPLVEPMFKLLDETYKNLSLTLQLPTSKSCITKKILRFYR